MTAVATPVHKSEPTAGGDGFGRLLRAEWTKFRTVRGWTIATVAAALLLVGLGVLTSLGSHSTVNGATGHPFVPTGPGGEAVTDQFYLAGQALTGDGAVTARITSLTGADDSGSQSLTGADQPDTGTATPWAKAGLIVKQDTRQGSAYAAVMVTGGHGVRMQYDYTGDIAGPAGTVSTASPRWLRLTRTGDDIAGYASTDGATWTTVGTVHLSRLATTVQVGMFVASPTRTTFDRQLGGGSDSIHGTTAAAVFDHVSVRWPASTGTWTGTSIGAGTQQPTLGAMARAGDGYTISGTGDIAPGNDTTDDLDHTLVGTFAALTVLIVLGVLAMTSEYRRGVILTSLTVSPRRGRMLAAKALVIGAVAFVTGLVGAAIAIPIVEHLLRANGNVLAPVTAPTMVRLVAGTAALLAVAAMLGLAVGALLRRSAAAVATVLVLVVLPYLIATAGVFPAGASRWLLRVTPTAAFAVQQSVPAYHQVAAPYDPTQGYFPLGPWAGFAVLCAWTAVALAAAAYLLRTRDA